MKLNDKLLRGETLPILTHTQEHKQNLFCGSEHSSDSSAYSVGYLKDQKLLDEFDNWYQEIIANKKIMNNKQNFTRKTKSIELLGELCEPDRIIQLLPYSFGFFLADNNNTFITVRSDWYQPYGSAIYISHIMVSQKYRRQGILKNTLNHIIKTITHHKVLVIEDITNKHLRQYLLRIGFIRKKDNLIKIIK